jgi:ribose 5-phosphate isomerase A
VRKADPVVTDQGNLVMDLATAGCIGDPQALKKESNNLPDVLGNGLFVNLTTQGLVEEIVDKLPGVRELTKR